MYVYLVQKIRNISYSTITSFFFFCIYLPSVRFPILWKCCSVCAQVGLVSVHRCTLYFKSINPHRFYLFILFIITLQCEVAEIVRKFLSSMLKTECALWIKRCCCCKDLALHYWLQDLFAPIFICVLNFTQLEHCHCKLGTDCLS